MLAARRLKFAAAASLSTMVAAIAIAGPLAGTAAAARKTTAPMPKVTVSPSAATTNQRSIDFTWTQVANETYTCALDGGQPLSCPVSSPPGATTFTYDAHYNVTTEGAHRFVLKASTGTGKTSSWPYQWTLDTVAPPKPTVSQPGDPTSTTSASITFSDAQPVDHFTCQLDANAVANPCAGGGNVFSVSGLSTGLHNFFVNAYDVAGNFSTTQVHWTISPTAPNMPTIDTPPAQKNNATTVSIGFHDDDSTYTGFTCSLSGPVTVAPTSCVSPFTAGGQTLTDGSYTFSVFASKTGAPQSATATASWVLDTVAPIAPTIQSAPGNPTDQTTATLGFFDNDPTVAKTLCQLVGATSTGFVACTGSATYPNLSNGTTYTFTVRAVDMYGNVADTSYSFKVDTAVADPPSFTGAGGPPSPDNEAAPTFFFDTLASTTPSVFLCGLDLSNPSSTSQYTDCTADSSDGSYTLTPALPTDGTKDGLHTFYVIAGYGTGTITYSAYASWTWALDTLPSDPPTISSGPVTPVRSVTNSTTAIFAFADSDANAKFDCTLTGTTLSGASVFEDAACATPHEYDGLAQGSYTFAVASVDNAGNKSAAAQNPTRTWTIDTAKPVLSMSSAVSGTLTNNVVDPDVTQSDSNPGTISCILSETSPVPGTAATDCAQHALSDGSYLFTADTTDLAGNPADTLSRTFTVDTTAPSAPSIVGSMQNGDLVSNRDQSFTVTKTDDSTVSMACAVDHDGASYADWTDCTDGALLLPGLADGSYTVKATATDAVDNTTQVPSTLSFTVDGTAPHAPTLTAAFNDGDYTSAKPSLTVTPDAADSDITAYACQLSGATAGPVPTPCAMGAGGILTLTATGGAALPDDSYTVTVTAIDNADNESAPSNAYHFVVDTTAPQAPLLGATFADGAFTSATPTLSVTPNSGDVDIASYACFLSGVNAGPVSLGSCSVSAGSLTLPKLADDSYTLQVQATDNAGNQSAKSNAYHFVVDTTKPVLSETGVPASLVNTTSVHVVPAQVDANPGPITCVLTGPVASNSCSATGLTDGAYTLKIDTTDKAGNKATQYVGSWTVDTTKPVLQVSGAPSGTVNSSSVTLTLGQTELHQNGITCTLTGPVSQSNCGPYSGLTTGAYTLKVDTIDKAGNAATEVVKTWSVDRTAPPVPSVTGPASTTETQPTFTLTDTESAVTYACALDAGTFTACTSPFQPPAALVPGSHKLLVRAADSLGNASAATPFVFAVTVASSGPVDSTAPTATVAATKTLTGASTVRFSETVHGLTKTGASLVLTGTTTVVPSKTVCLVGTTAVACGGNFTALRLTPRSALMPGQHYTVRLLAGAVKDAAGNPLVAKSLNFRGSRAEQETTPGATTLWASGNSKKAYGGSFLRENTKGASATYTFTGTNITWWTSTGRNQGKATVFIDGVRKGVVNNYAAATHFKVARSYSKLSNKRHTIRIVVRGVKGRKVGTGTYVTVDAFSVGKKRVNTPVLKTGWKSLAAKQLSGGHAAVAKLKGESLTFVFRGTAITWVTERSRNQGKVAVYIDGVRKAVVDNFATTTRFGVKRSLGHLSNKVHTLKLRVLGTHHKGGTGTWVTVDRFLIT